MLRKVFLADILTSNVVVADQGLTVSNALDKMRQQRISSVVVMDKNQPVGIITERDAVLLASRHQDPSSVLVRDVMSKPLVTAPPEMEYREGFRLISERRVRHLIVVGESGGLLGVVTEGDFLEHLGGEFLVQVKKVNSLMTHNVTTLPETATGEEILHIMARDSLSCIVIERDGFPVGVFTERDLVGRDASDIHSQLAIRLMTTPVHRVTTNTSLPDAIGIMDNFSIRRLVVVDEKGALVGLITRHDIVKQLYDRHVEHLLDALESKEQELLNIRTELDMERDLRHAEQRLQNLLDTLPYGVQENDRQGSITYSNPAHHHILGLNPGELIGRHVWDFQKDDNSKQKIRDDMRLVLENQPRPEPYITTNIKSDGKKVILRIDWNYRRDEGGNITGFTTIISDITEQVQSQKKLEDSIGRYELVAAGSSAAVWDCDLVNKQVYYSPRWKELRGFQDEEVSDSPDEWSFGIHPDDRDRVLKAVDAHLAGTTGYFQEEYRVKCKNGSWKWVLDRGLAQRDAEGNAIRIAGAETDITRHKGAQQALQHSEQRFRTIFEQAAVGVALLNSLTGEFIRINQRYCDIVGYSIEEMSAGVSFQEITYPDDLQEDLDNMEKLRAGDIRRFSMEKRYCHKDGSIVWGRLTVSPTWEIGELPDTHIAVVEDITEQKEVENALIESERRLSTLMSNLPGMAYRCQNDELWTVEFTSDGCEQLTGYKPEALLHNRDISYSDLVYEEDLPQIAQEIDDAISVNKSYTLVYRIRRKDGELRWVWEQGQLVETNEHGGVLEGFINDISDLKQAEKEIKQSHQRLLEAEDIAHIGSWELDIATLVAHWSDKIHDIFGSNSSDEVGPVFLSKMVHPEDWPALESSLYDAMHKGAGHEMEYRIKRPGGEERWVYCKAQRKLDAAGKPLKLTGIVQDITYRKQQEEQLRLSAGVYENTNEGVVITNAQGEIIDVNRAFTEIAGYTREDVIGKNPKILQSGQQDENFYSDLWSSLLKSGQWQGEIWNRRKNGDVFPEWLNISSIANSQGEITHYVGVFSDISKIKQSEEKLYNLAHHDVLTNLPNRLLLNERLEQALKRAKRGKSLVAVMFLDLDNFKQINDSLGHPVGDQLLQQVAFRLKNQVRQDDTISRISGDEFVIVMGDLCNDDDVIKTVEKLLAEFTMPFQLDSQEIGVTASIGIGLYPQDGIDAQTLLRNADAAMYRAKESGRNTYQFYTEEMTAKAYERLFLVSRLRQAIEKQEFYLCFQPQINLSEQKVVGAEVLIRWKHPELGTVSPAQFIPLAEEAGLIIAIGEWVLRSACFQAAQWLAQGIEFGRIAVNVAGQQIQRGSLVDTVENILQETGLPASCLELEVTEGFIMQDASYAIKQLNSLRQLGVLLAIDDFGTGYSSLSYLKKMPIHKLKIDQGFVREIPYDPNDMAISDAVISMGKSLGLTVIAEGVETEQQARFLTESGCHEAQGYLYSKPIPADEAEKFFKVYNQSTRN